MSDNLQSVWTEDRLADLTRLLGEGLSITQIGLVIGVSRNAVVGKVHRMGLPKRQSPIVKSDKPRAPQAPVQRRRAVPLTLEQWDRNTCSWPTGDPKTEISASAVIRLRRVGRTAPPIARRPTPRHARRPPDKASLTCA